MTVRLATLYYGVCDNCGAEDDDSRPTVAEAEARMWPSADGKRLLCWDCVEQEEAA